MLDDGIKTRAPKDQTNNTTTGGPDQTYGNSRIALCKNSLQVHTHCIMSNKRLPFGVDSLLPSLRDVPLVIYKHTLPEPEAPTYLRLSESACITINTHIRTVGLDSRRFDYTVKSQSKILHIDQKMHHETDIMYQIKPWVYSQISSYISLAGTSVMSKQSWQFRKQRAAS